MRLAVLSDIHGNLPALEAVLAEAERAKVDGYILAGDYQGGPYVVEIISLIRSLAPSWIIRGNGEESEIALIEGRVPDAWYKNKQFGLGRWIHAHLDQSSLDFICSLPAQSVCAIPGTPPIRIVHGSPRDSIEHLYPDRDPIKMALFYRAGFPGQEQEPISLKTALSEIGEAFLVCGHTHISWQQSEDGKLALNPGSVSVSAERDALAHFAVLTWNDGTWQVELRAVPYDHARLHAACRDSGALEAGGPATRALLLNCEIGENVWWHFLCHARRLAAAAGYADCSAIPDEILDEADWTFDWEYKGQGS